jgi:peptidyl-prolyl cis-trans isomerase C
MKALFLLGCLGLGVLQAQKTPPPQPPAVMPKLPDETLIATFPDGTTLNMAQFKTLFAALPPNLQQMALQNRQEFLDEYSLMRDLTKIADQKKLDQESPYKEMLAFARVMVLMQAAMADANRSVSVEDSAVEKRYTANREKFKQVRVRAIRIALLPTEAEAKAKAERIAAEARRGADFGKLVRENSADEASRSKGGDYGVIRLSDGNDAVRLAVFSLKHGEISDPVRQQGGFYIFRAEEVSYQPLSEVRGQIYAELQTEQYRTWLDGISGKSKVQSVNPAFLAEPPKDPKSQLKTQSHSAQ